MKKVMLFFLIPLLFLCSCGRDPAKKAADMTPEEIIDAVYEKTGSDEYLQKTVPELMTYEINAENEEYYLGISGIPYVSGAASEAVVQPLTFSFAVIRLKEDCDHDAERIKIENNINKAKWVCAKAEEAYVVRYNDLIAVIMGPASACNAIESAFLSIARQ